jgi:hypothetical protein
VSANPGALRLSSHRDHRIDQIELFVDGLLMPVDSRKQLGNDLDNADCYGPDGESRHHEVVRLLSSVDWGTVPSEVIRSVFRTIVSKTPLDVLDTAPHERNLAEEAQSSLASTAAIRSRAVGREGSTMTRAERARREAACVANLEVLRQESPLAFDAAMHLLAQLVATSRPKARAACCARQHPARARAVRRC